MNRLPRSLFIGLAEPVNFTCAISTSQSRQPDSPRRVRRTARITESARLPCVPGKIVTSIVDACGSKPADREQLLPVRR
jgi:hypothetical protein